MNQARQAQKSQMIGRRYGNRFSSSALEGITQHATWSRDRNDWIIKVNDPRAEGGFREVGVGELYGDNDERLRNIFPEDKQDRLIDYVKDIRNFLSPGELQAASEKNSVAVVMGTISRMGMADKQRLFADERFRMTRENAEENARIVNQITDATWEAQRQMNDAIQNGEMSKLVGTYTEWSLKQNNDMLQQMTNFVHSGWTIERMLDEIKYAVLGVDTISSISDLIRYQSPNGYTLYKDNIDQRTIEYYNKYHKNEAIGALGGLSRYGGRKATPYEQALFLKEYMEGSVAIDNGKILGLGDGTLRTSSQWSINANDAIITPRGVVYTHPDDMIAAFKPDGALMNSQSSSTLEVNGTLKLEAGSQSVDLIELVKNDPQFFREMTERILIEANKNKYGGRSMHAPNRFAL